jgi:hypothetical protein
MAGAFDVIDIDLAPPLRSRAVSPVVIVARQQPDAVAVAVNDEAKAVVFYLVNPFGSGRHLGAPGRDRWLKLHEREDMR